MMPADSSAAAVIHRARVWASARSLAFSIANPAVKRQRLDELLVLFGEVTVAVIGQVQVAEDFTADPDRHPEERLHRRMIRREADRARVVRHPGQPNRVGIGDQGSQQTTSLRQMADRGCLLVGQSDIQELLERVALRD